MSDITALLIMFGMISALTITLFISCLVQSRELARLSRLVEGWDVGNDDDDDDPEIITIVLPENVVALPAKRSA